jgi:uroporphyrinogen decarboxylase
MTRKERMLTAMHRQAPDRVPVCPDTSAMVPARLTGKPFWDIFYYEDPYIGDAYIDLLKYYGSDGWYIYDELPFGNAALFAGDAPMVSLAPFSGHIPASMLHEQITARTDERIVVDSEIETPLGPLTRRTVYPKGDVPWPEKKWIQDIERDWPRLHWLMGEEWRGRPEFRNRDKLGDLGVYSLMLFLPIDWWFAVRDGTGEELTFDLIDCPDVMQEIFDHYTRFALAQLDAFIESGVADELHIQGSASSLSISSLNFYKRYNLPFVQEVTRRCKQAGLISHEHVCGRSKAVVQLNYELTDLDVMEPLEGPPAGDVNLAHAKHDWGDRLAFKGNLNTFDLMLNGTPQEVEQAAKEAIDAAGEGGGFILSTGDQCGRDTPDANLFKLVEVSKTYGWYR